MTNSMLRGRFDAARDQLGHTAVVMTDNYIRKRIGKN